MILLQAKTFCRVSYDALVRVRTKVNTGRPDLAKEIGFSLNRLAKNPALPLELFTLEWTDLAGTF